MEKEKKKSSRHGEREESCVKVEGKWKDKAQDMLDQSPTTDADDVNGALAFTLFFSLYLYFYQTKFK